MDEREMLAKLGKTTLQQITSGDMPAILQMLPNMTPEVAKKALDVILSYPQTATELSKCLQQTINQGFVVDGNVTKAVNDADRAIIDGLLKQLDRPDLSADERHEIRNDLLEYSRRMHETNTEEKGFIERVVDSAKEHQGWIWGGLLFVGSLFLGGKYLNDRNNHNTKT